MTIKNTRTSLKVVSKQSKPSAKTSSLSQSLKQKPLKPTQKLSVRAKSVKAKNITVSTAKATLNRTPAVKSAASKNEINKTDRKTAAKVAAVPTLPVIARNPSGASKKKDSDELAREILGIYANPVARKKKVVKRPGMDFIGSFPLKNGSDDGRVEKPKLSSTPVFDPRKIRIRHVGGELGLKEYQEFRSQYIQKITKDSFEQSAAPRLNETLEQLQAGLIDVFICDMDFAPLEPASGFHVATVMKREDPRDALVTGRPYGALAELPRNARVGCLTSRHAMQVRAQRPDLVVEFVEGSASELISKVDNATVDALLIPWALLRRLDLTPRFYAALQADQLLPSPCQGILAAICRSDDEDMLQRLKMVEDSEANWASRCERAFLKKLNGSYRAPVGAFAHRKGTQDPWILDAIIGDESSGDVLRYREIGTSRCKPESLADKAYAGILARGAKKFLPFLERSR